MLRMALLVLAACFARPAWAAFRKDQAFLGADMQPAVVAKTLSRVEDEWKARARAYIKCELAESQEAAIRDCDDTPSDFSKSCSTVVSAVVQGSSGNPGVMKEYMGKVCNQDVMLSWHQTSCIALANTIGTKMSASQYDNRDNFQTSAVCDDFWSNFLAEQKTLHNKELVHIKEEEKKAVEVAAEEAKKAEERSVKAQKDLEEAEHGDSAKEEAELESERQMVASRANRKVGTVDKSLQEKEAEVDAVEDAAQKKIDEATQLEEEPLTPSAKDDAAQRIAKSVENKAEPLTKLVAKVVPKVAKPAEATIGKKVSTATKSAARKPSPVLKQPVSKAVPAVKA